MKKEAQTKRSLWLVVASLAMAFLLAVTSFLTPQMISVSYAKYVSNENAGVFHLSINHAHAILTTGFKLNRALATGTTTNGAPTAHTEITANTSLTEVYFGTPTEYASQIAGITPVDVSYYGDGSIKLYKNGTKAYIVSDRTIATCEHFGSVFEKFTKLTKVHFSGDFDTSRAETFAYLFFGASSITTIENLNTFNTSNATSMQSMFYASSPSLKSLDLSSFNTDKVEDMGSIFRGNSALTSIDVSGFNTENVWDMGGMFEGCSSLGSIDVTGFDTSKVETMQVMFQGCTGLKTLDLRSFSCESLENMSSMFANCTYLTTIYADYDFDCRGISDPVATDETDANGNYTIPSGFSNIFKGCTNLVGGSGTKYDSKIVHNLRAVVDVQLAVEQVVFQSTVGYFTHYSGADPGSAYLKNGQDFNAAIKTLANSSSKAYSFSDAKIKKIYFGKTGSYNVSGLSSTNVDNANSGTIKAYWNASTGTIYVLSDSTICFSSSSDYMFAYMSILTGIYFDNISTSAARTMQHMFAYCPKLSDLDLSKFETQNIVDYGSCFRNAAISADTANTKIIPYLNTSKARDIGGLFINCTNLIGALNMGNLSSAKAETVASLVEGCTGITSIDISGFTNGVISNSSSMFNGCSKLTRIYTNSSFNLNNGNVTNHGGMFTGCTALKGGNGTAFSTSYIDKTYARPDTAGQKGYFTVMTAQSLSLRSVALGINDEPISDSDISSETTSVSSTDINVSDTDAAVTTTAATTTTTTAAAVVTTATTTTTASGSGTTTTDVPVSSGDMSESTTASTAVSTASSIITSVTEATSTTATAYTSDSTTASTSATTASETTTASASATSTSATVSTTTTVAPVTTTTAATTTTTTTTTTAAPATTTTATTAAATTD